MDVPNAGMGCTPFWPKCLKQKKLGPGPAEFVRWPTVIAAAGMASATATVTTASRQQSARFSIANRLAANSSSSSKTVRLGTNITGYIARSLAVLHTGRSFVR